jgi:FAD/FMN-containing dehydrogenase
MNTTPKYNNGKTKRGGKSNKASGSSALVEKGVRITDLRSNVKGRVITPDDADYSQACSIFYGGIDRKPAAIVRVADAQDVAGVVSLAGKSGIELAVRSGGHSMAGYGLTEGGIVIDLRDMRELRIDVDNHTAWVETGMTTGEFTAAADAYDLATGFGDTGSVGIGGLTLGGGVGYLVRKHGMSIDNLLAAEIVTADGTLHRVDAVNEPNLFWAIRGGGGNFGVATRFQFRLHEIGKVVGGMLILPATPEVIAGFINEAEAAPEELSTIANIMSAPPMPFLPTELHGKVILMAMMVYAGDVDSGMEAIAPFRKLAKPLADMLRPMRYMEMFPSEEGNFHPTAVGHTMFVDQIDRDVAGKILENLLASDASMRVAQLRVLGGAMGRIADDATAYSHRQRRIMVNLGAFYNSPEERATRQIWIDDFAAALPQKDPGAYVNFMGAEGEARVRSAYPGATWERLAAIKAIYDPTNLFRLNQNIPPSTKTRHGQN